MAKVTKKRANKVQRGGPEAETLGAVVRELRLAQQMTQASLAEAGDLDTKYVGLVENGGTNISLPNLLKLAHGLGISPGDLLRAAFPPDDRKDLETPLLQDLLVRLQNEDNATLELLWGMLGEIKKWENRRN